jgi:serine/threonine protein kinase
MTSLLSVLTMKPTRRVRRRKQTRRGGKKLGEGKYGFVIEPAIPCVGKDTTGYVSKVFKTKEEFDKAKTNPVYAKLKEIDPDQTRFLYPELCDTSGELTDENKQDGVTEENKSWSYLVKKGGDKTLYEYLETVNKYVTKDTVKYMMGELRNVFESVKILHDNNILHDDLHTKNILVTADGKFHIIDFDRSFLLTDKDKLSAYFKGWKVVPRTDEAKIEECKNNELQGFIEEVGVLIQKKRFDIVTAIEMVYAELGID